MASLRRIILFKMPYKNDDFFAVLDQVDFTNRDVTFLFAEIRKLIESGSVEYKTLKFYCDWLLHPKKDRFYPEMKQYIKDIYDHAVLHIKNPMHYEYSRKIADLIYFEELKNDLAKVLDDQKLPKKILDGETWLNLIRVLVKLLENQPLMHPIDDVSSIVFTPSAEGAVILFINFSVPVMDRDQNPQHFYKMGNYY